jgi:tetrahydromethanopterin S-methyltransferase subunit B
MSSERDTNPIGDAVQVAAERAEAAAAASQAHVDRSQSAAGAAQQAAQQAQAAGTEPSWIYGMVVGFLGVALLVLITAIVIASLSPVPPHRLPR